VKTGIVMAASGIPPEEARKRITKAGGTVRGAIALNAGGGERSGKTTGKTG
jgi:N-acetylmuramic acid 6-phosphate (MurNAc-6-P) etherase